MPDNLSKNLADILPDFFDKKQIKEFISLYKSSVSSQPDSDKNKEAEKNKVDLLNGLNYRTQLDLLITFSSNKLPKDKFLSLLLYLSQASITSGEFASANSPLVIDAWLRTKT